MLHFMGTKYKSKQISLSYNFGVILKSYHKIRIIDWKSVKLNISTSYLIELKLIRKPKPDVTE